MNLKPRKIFYGWWIVAASFLVAMFASGAINYGFTTVFEPISNDLGWSYAQISLAASLRGFESGLLSPVAGLVVDRWGPRRVISAGAVVTSLGFMLLSRTSSLGMFYVAFVLMAMGSSTFMTVLMTVVVNWFRKKVGMAIGIAVCGFGAGGLIIPLIAHGIDVLGWRQTMSILSVGALVYILPLSLVFRHRPEQYGYLPDGDSPKEPAPFEKGVLSLRTIGDSGWKPKQALRSSIFWRLILSMMCLNIVLSAVSTHVMPYLSTIGIARSVSSFVAGAVPLISVGGRLGFGWLGDRFEKRRMLIVSFAMVTAGSFAFGCVPLAGDWLLIAYVGLFGLGLGGSIALRPAIVREYFGTASFGTIFGFVMSAVGVGAIIGPPLAGWVYDNWGSYQGIWLAYVGLLFVAVVVILTIPSAGVEPKRAVGPHPDSTS